MRIPKIESQNENVKTKIIHLSDIEPLEYSTEIVDRDKFIKRIERIVRQSYEYRELINFLKEEMDFDHCLLLSNLDIHSVKIELHHEPLRLYDVVDTIVRKHEKLYGDDISIFDIANEVMETHYKGLIPLVPITETVHELVHAGEVFIPIQLISQGGFGNWKRFVSEYRTYMSPDFVKRLRDYVDMSNKVIDDYSVPILERKYTYIDCEGVKLPRRIQVDEEEVI